MNEAGSVYPAAMADGAKPAAGRDAGSGDAPLSVVYADCKAALEQAWRQGLPREVPVRTLSPAILADTTIAAEPADERLTPEGIAALESALLGAADEVWHTLRSRDDLDHAADIAGVAARSLLADFQGYVYAAAMLRDGDFGASVAVVASVGASPDLHRRFDFRAADVLRRGGEPRIIEIPHRLLPDIGEPTPPVPPFGTRLTKARFGSLLARLGMEFWDRIPLAGPGGTILVLRTNELLKETVARFLMRGYVVRGLRMPAATDLEPDEREEGIVSACVTEALRRHLDGLVTPGAIAPVAELGGRGAATAQRTFRQCLPAWREEMDRHRRHRPQAVISNMLITPGAAALYAVLRERGIPLIGFQHGVTPEISARTKRYAMNLENSWCDLVIVFNQRMAALCASNPYGAGKAAAVGMPGEYRSLAKSRPTRSRHPVWYVRTTLYHSNMARLHRGISDRAMLDRETLLIDRVLSRLPHGVTYKPYPAIRFLDPDPVLDHAAGAQNIVVYEERLDLQYLVRRARVLITSGATSTVSWCLMSGRPTVFIDSPWFMPLDAPARAAFGEGLFLFDEGAPDFHESLRRFLSRPIEDIEAEWEGRAPARAGLMEEFFCEPSGDPGGRAVQAITSHLAGARSA